MGLQLSKSSLFHQGKSSFWQILTRIQGLGSAQVWDGKGQGRKWQATKDHPQCIFSDPHAVRCFLLLCSQGTAPWVNQVLLLLQLCLWPLVLLTHSPLLSESCSCSLLWWHASDPAQFYLLVAKIAKVSGDKIRLYDILNMACIAVCYLQENLPSWIWLAKPACISAMEPLCFIAVSVEGATGLTPPTPDNAPWKLAHYLSGHFSGASLPSITDCHK